MLPMLRVFILLLCCCLSSCAGLIVRDDDSAGLAAGKVFVRTVMAIPTLGISEGVMLDLKDEERNRAWRWQLLPQTEEACRTEWRHYVQDRQLKIATESVRDTAVTAVSGDYINGPAQLLGVTGLFEPLDPLQAEWHQTLAQEPQAALLSQCAKRFGGIRRFFPSP